MALARNRRSNRSVDYWPGFVDALATLLLAIMFLLTVFVIGQFILTREISGKDEVLLLGSDGVFDAMNNEEAVKLAGGAAEKEKGGGSAGAMAGAGAVVGQAAAWWRRNPGSDNITAIVVTPLRQ